VDVGLLVVTKGSSREGWVLERVHRTRLPVLQPISVWGSIISSYSGVAWTPRKKSIRCIFAIEMVHCDASWATFWTMDTSLLQYNGKQEIAP